jgi:predicted nucleotidyltransferase
MLLYGSRSDRSVTGLFMTLHDLRTKRETILAIAERYGARDLRVFGSVVRGEADAGSDVDFLVELEPGRSLFDLGGLLMDLQEHLDCKVDVMTPAMLKPRVRERILREATPL